MSKPFKLNALVIFGIFILGFALDLVAIRLAGFFSWLALVFLFISHFFYFLLIIGLLPHRFNSLIVSLSRLRRWFRLSNLTHPLLLRLSADAPGTFYHSVMVANIAARAAKMIGADSLLCRTASYFHDIGKLKNPQLFIENQPEGEIKPAQSIQEINDLKKHVDEGVKIAQEANLPKEIINLIAQHHGTTFCSYFFKFMKKRKSKRFIEENFRYSGPKPQTKEAAVLMLADSLEARTRVDNGSIKEIVETTFEDKIKDHQLDESSLSPREINKLKYAFIETLEGIRHQRVSYF